MSNYDKSGLTKEKVWRTEDKAKLTSRLSRAKTTKQFNQILNVINQHTTEIIRINRGLKDMITWN